MDRPCCYSPKPHTTNVCQRMKMEAPGVTSQLQNSRLFRTQGLIGGKWTEAYDGKTIQVHDPATGEVIADVPFMGQPETIDAISSAYNAFNSWSKITAIERSQCLWKWHDLLTAHKEELGQLITLEQGKPLNEAIIEVIVAAGYLEFFAEEAKHVYSDIIPSTVADCQLFVIKQPVGVIGAITPWNFPLAILTQKVGPALACGCTVVLKPSELTPLIAFAAAELALEAGIPPVIINISISILFIAVIELGALNVITGNAPDIEHALLASPKIRKITFTGLSAVEKKKIKPGAGQTPKKVSLELGGNAACVVFDDADLDVAVKSILALKFHNSGQTCISANRILVQEGIYEKFANAFSGAVESLQVGNGFCEGVTQGPLINEAAVQMVDSLVIDAISKGAKLLLGGKRHDLGMTFYEPTVIGDVNNKMLISRNKICGPVAALRRFKTEEEAIYIANDTIEGLAAYIFTKNFQRAWSVSEVLEYGLVGVNEGLIQTVMAPISGFKYNGLRQEGSRKGMLEYLELKYICLGNMNNA